LDSAPAATLEYKGWSGLAKQWRERFELD
jgi:hypothetical protein